MNYIKVVDKHQGPLNTYLFKDFHLLKPNTHSLLAARCMYSILETVQSLYAECGMVVFNIVPDNINIKKNWFEGTLHRLACDTKAPFTCLLVYPYYSEQKSWNERTLASAVIATLVNFMFFTGRALFNLKANRLRDDRETRPLSSLEFMKWLMENSNPPHCYNPALLPLVSQEKEYYESAQGITAIKEFYML